MSKKSNSYKLLISGIGLDGEYIKTLLEEHNIPCVVKELGDGWVDGKWRYPQYIPDRGSEVYVPAELLNKALEIVEADDETGEIDLEEYPQFKPDASDDEYYEKYEEKKERRKKREKYYVLAYLIFFALLIISLIIIFPPGSN